MNETTKTLVFVAVAGISLIAAYATQRPSAELDLPSLVGTKLGSFDPGDAKRLKLVKFDEDTATLSEFEVAQDDVGLWTLPSKNGYPADAERQMGEATATVMDREVLAVVSSSAADHEQYGVIDPDPGKIEAGQKGVGSRITVSDISDDSLVDLIVGGEVKDAENQYYARKANQDTVYVIEFEPDKLSTKFEDWIESDLLQLNSWDIQDVAINDYSAELVLVGFQPQIEWDRRGEYRMTYNDTDSKWIPDSLKSYNRETSEFEEAPLAENEELNSDKLGELKSALDDLKIVDVEKKPAGLSANLKAGDDFLKDNEAFSSLVQRGFAAVPLNSEDLEILSSEGEVICTMKNGVEYVLRFGNLQVQVGAEESPADSGSADGTEEESSDEDVNRYLFVMARFNEEAVARPELAELPELPADTDDEGSKEANGDDGTPAEATEEASADESAAEADNDADSNEVQNGDEAESATTSGDEDEVEGESAEASTDDSTDKGEEGDGLDEIIAERKRLEEENQRKLDEYKEKLDEGREKVKDLNLRFGDWYYVIANDVFQKIRLKRDDLVKEKEASEEEDAAEEASEFGAPGTSVPGLPNLGP